MQYVFFINLFILIYFFAYDSFLSILLLLYMYKLYILDDCNGYKCIFRKDEPFFSQITLMEQGHENLVYLKDVYKKFLLKSLILHEPILFLNLT